MKTLKMCLPDLLAVLLFVLISFAYFFPADIEGRILYRHSDFSAQELAREISIVRESN